MGATQVVLLWALWVNGGGNVNSGYLQQPYISSYFATKEECERVQHVMVQSFTTNGRPEYAHRPWTRCIQANYVLLPKAN